jgi:hypothetical protein
MFKEGGGEWRTDEELLASLPGGRELIDWFGFVPTFHDATLLEMAVRERTVVLRLHCFRITDAVNARGFFILDKHTDVAISLSGVTGLTLNGDAAAIVSELGVRRVGSSPPRLANVAGPSKGDYELSIESSYGLEGSIFAKGVSFTYSPT